MELNRDEPVMKSKTLALKFMARRSGGKTVRSFKVWKSKETSNGDSDDEEMSFTPGGSNKCLERTKDSLVK